MRVRFLRKLAWPAGVLPQYQGRWIGSCLVCKGLARRHALARGYDRPLDRGFAPVSGEALRASEKIYNK
jgi:hypothetical protein